MQVTEIPAEGLKRQFKIVVPAGDLAAKVDERLAEMARTASLPGFRPGKVPAGAAEEAVWPGAVGEALEQAVNQSTAKAIEDRGLKPALQPKIELKGSSARARTSSSRCRSKCCRRSASSISPASSSSA